MSLYRIGPFRLDSAASILFHGSDPVALGQRAVALLAALIGQAGAPVSKDALMAAAWPGLIVEEANLTVQIAALRRALSAEPGGERWIETLPRRGYRFIGPVEPISTTQPPSGPAAAPAKPATAERRQLTVMACELLGTPDDLDAAQDVARAFRQCVLESTRRFDGTVGRQIGHALLVCFGYPKAHEHDAERAVRVGLDLLDAVHRIAAELRRPLTCRIGIATGPAIIGDGKGGPDTTEEPGAREIIGNVPAVAGRLQASAPPDTLVIDAVTRRLIGNLFHCRELDANGTEPSRWLVLGLSGVESRFDAFRAASLTPLVGRDEELALLGRRWEQAKHGEGRVVLISGEPGIGKSRIALALQDMLEGEPHLRMRYYCSPYRTNSAFYPVIDQLQRVLRLDRSADAAETMARLEALLNPAARRIPHAAALLADLLSLPVHSALSDMTPEQRKKQACAAIIAQLEGMAAESPVLIIYEDIHWLDPTSRELLSLIIRRAPALRLLLVATFRPEFEAPWVGESHVTPMLLNRLGARDRAVMVASVAGQGALPPRRLEEIAARTDGVPLFVEELTRAVLEADDTATPATLQASLVARLDRAGGAKEIAQLAAVIGREFSYELLAAISQHDEQELRACLEELTRAGLLFCQGAPPDATYQFKHALVQDAAYDMLLKARRSELHGVIAQVFEQRFASVAQTQPEVVADHYTKAGLAASAIEYWLKAGQLAKDRSANQEAVSHLSRALALLQELPAGGARDALELRAECARADAHRHPGLWRARDGQEL